MSKAVVLGCNYYIGLSIIRCLGKNGVHVVACDYSFDNKNYGAKSKYINEFLKVKTLNHIDEDAKNELINFAKKQADKPVLFPTHDKYVDFIDTYYSELSKYFYISQSENAVNSTVMDKWKLRKIALDNNVKLPQTYHIKEENIIEKVNQLGFPCIIKPAENSEFIKLFRKKVFVCQNADELKENIEKCLDNNLEAFVQEIVPGFDDHMLTYDCYIDRSGKTTHYMTAQKYRQWPINFGASVFTRQKYNKTLVDIGKPFLENIGYRGFGEIEFKKHAVTGEIYLIEINARTTNFNNLIYKVGLNMPYIAYKDLTQGLTESDYKYIDYDTNYAFIYGFEDFMALRAYSKTKQLSFIKGFLQIFSKKLAPAIWDIKDMKPWFAYNKLLLARAWNKIIKK